MATILKGAPVVAAMNEANAARCAALAAKGITPTLAVVRVGKREDDLSYERGVMTRCGKVGVAVRQFLLPADATQDALLDLQNQLDEAQTTIDALESSAEETDAALAEAQRENQALLALYTIQQQYSAGDLAGCQASIDAFEASEYRDALPETAEEGVTPPSQRYAQLKEAAEAR